MQTLLTERQAKNVECDAVDEEAQKTTAAESSIENTAAVEEQDMVMEDAQPIDEAAQDEAEDDDVEKAVSETVIFIITIVHDCFGC